MEQGTEKLEAMEKPVTKVYDYRYTGSQQQQIGGDGPIPGSTWTTAHDNPGLPDYISLGPGPLY